MDDLPLDVRKIIAFICDDATKRQLRLASTRWFQIIDYRNFPLYLTKKAEWKQIVDRLAKYTKPISLTLREAVIELEDVLEHLTLLTNLSSLDLQSCKTTDELEWLGLTALTNLTAVKGLESEVPYEFWKHMTRLEEFYAADYPPITKDELDLVTTLTNLHKLEIWTDHLSLDCITEVYTKLTFLEISFDGVAEWTEKDLQRLSKLKHFTFNHDNEDTQVPKKAISLKYMTDLEVLCTSCPFENLNSTKLHGLKNYQFTEAEKLMFPKMAGLTYLGPIKLEHDTEYLAQLTNLKVLSICSQKNPDTDQRYSILGNLATTKLISLYIDNAKTTIDFGFLTQIGSIQTLNLEGTQISGNNLTVLSNLTSLKLDSLTEDDDSVPNSLKKLTKLKRLIYCPNSPLDFALDLSPLTNLESLSFKTDGRQYIKLGDCSNLTYFDLQSFYLHPDKCHRLPYLTKMTNLQVLKCTVISDVIQHVSVMTNLKDLTVQMFNTEEDVLLLTVLQNLVKLQCDFDIKPEKTKGIYLTRLTALRELRWTHLDPDIAIQIQTFPNMRHWSNY